ncbi:MAG: DUF507 family protein [Terriglobia bacterium]
MKLSRDKLLHVSHLLVDRLAEIEHVDFLEDRNTIRQEIFKIMDQLMKDEEAIETTARNKLLSQKRQIPEGSQEWDILMRKYYQEELKKLGIL